MKNERQHRSRVWVVGILFIILWFLLLWRMVDLTVVDRLFLQGQGNARSLRMMLVPAYRGMIIDREGGALAVSTPVHSLWVNPKVFQPTQKQLRSLARRLDLSVKFLQQRIHDASGRGFMYLKRQINPMLAKEIEDLNIPGLHFQEEFKRFYPEADSIAQLLGFTNVDDKGIEGLELAYNHWLAGYSGQIRVIKDRMGRVIKVLDTVKDPQPGHLLQLSVDRRIQYFAYNALQKTIEKFGAKSGSVVVLDTQNGEVLALVNAPSFNPNARSNYALNRYRNQALTDTFEPGSVMKPLSIASALDTGSFVPSSIIDTRPGWMTVQGHTIRDVHHYGVLDVTGVLRYSSNVGVTKMVLTHPAEQLMGLLTRAGIGQRTESGYPGESEGSMVKVSMANPFVLATLSFGYGMSVTAMQVAKSYLMFANHGEILPIRLLRQQQPAVGVQVISAKTADQVLTMMEAVVNDGTGKSGMVPGYRVAGKTGTARVAGKNGYGELRYLSSFVGIAPVSNPRLIVAVFIHEPSKGGYYGAAVAAPLFANVMGTALRILHVPPDRPL